MYSSAIQHPKVLHSYFLETNPWNIAHMLAHPKVLHPNNNIFLCESDVKNDCLEAFWKVWTPDVLLKQCMFLIGVYSETLFSENMGCPFVHMVQTELENTCAIHSFNMVDISESNSGEEFKITTEKNISGSRFEKEFQSGTIIFCWRFDSLSRVSQS